MGRVRTYEDIVRAQPTGELEPGDLVVLLERWDNQSPRWAWLRAWLDEPQGAWIRTTIPQFERDMDAYISIYGTVPYGGVQWGQAATPRHFLMLAAEWSKNEDRWELWKSIHAAWLEAMPFEFMVTEG